jgi:hypothetical protein
MALSMPRELITKEMVFTVLSVPHAKAATAANRRAITPTKARYFDLSRMNFIQLLRHYPIIQNVAGRGLRCNILYIP